MSPHSPLHAPAVALGRRWIPLFVAVLLAVPGAATAQGGRPVRRPIRTSSFRRPAVDLRSVFKPYGAIATVSGLKGTADASGAAASSMPPAVQFAIPDSLKNRVKPGQPVWMNMTRDMIEFVRFPILVPNTRTVVGRGAGHGKFYVETRDMKVSNTGLISGRVKVLSDDYVEGFTGMAWVRLTDADGNELDGELLKCIGVNARSGDEQWFQLSIPATTAVKVKNVELWQMQSSCGRDRTQAFLNYADQAAKVAGGVEKVAAAIFGGGA